MLLECISLPSLPEYIARSKKLTSLSVLFLKKFSHKIYLFSVFLKIDLGAISFIYLVLVLTLSFSCSILLHNSIISQSNCFLFDNDI